MNVVFVEPAVPADPAALRPRAGRGRGHRHRRRRAAGRLARRRAPRLDVALPPGADGHRRRRADRRGALDPGPGCGSTGWRPRSRRTRWPPRRSRENCTIPGTSVRTAWLCRDKPSMKEALRAAGVPTAASAAVAHRRRGARVRRRGRLPAHPQAAHRRRRAGHRAGRRQRPARRRRWAGSAARASSRSRSRSSSRATRASTTRVSIDGHAALDFVSHYYPNVLEAMRTRWISPQFVSTNRVDSAAGLPGAARAGRPGQRGARHRHQRHAHGVVLRARRGCGSPRSAAGRPASARGTSTRPATTSTSTASGRTRSCTAHVGAAPVAAVRHRDRRAAARPRRAHHRLLRRRRGAGPARASG